MVEDYYEKIVITILTFMTLFSSTAVLADQTSQLSLADKQISIELSSSTKFLKTKRIFDRRLIRSFPVKEWEDYPYSAPEYIWHEEGGYVGYLKMSSWEGTPSKFIVSYSGTLRKESYAPLKMEGVVYEK